MSDSATCALCNNPCWERFAVRDEDGLLNCSTCWARFKDGRKLRDSMVFDLGNGKTMPAKDYLRGMAELLTRDEPKR